MTVFGSRRFRLTGRIDAIAVAPDGRRVAGAASLADDTAVWDVATGERLLSIRRSADRLSWSADGELLALGQAGVEVWDVSRRQRVARITDARAPVVFLDAEHLAMRDERGQSVRVVAVRRGEMVRSLRVTAARDLARSPTGRLLVLIDQHRTLRIADLDTGSSQPLGEATQARFCGDDVLIWGAADHLRALQLPQGYELWHVPSERIGGLAVAPNGRWVAA